ncbi:hypothetical protein [Saccharothrix longispora]|uniref:hypothetical protein n=1 Tax=Saccharothrix longispora TaxID=33920 RepID=UPI0028FD0707|nr:hypothetical protein [Saccharothrix longispora]MDU0292118.1 hypothetical protein [Saccharothrix longispora]
MRLAGHVPNLPHVGPGLVAPPDRAADELPPDHSPRRLRRLVDGEWPARGALPDPLTP